MKKLLLTLIFLVLFSVSTHALDVSAKSAVLINGATGEVLFEKNCNEQLPMASTTKIMTALLLAEENTPDKCIKTTKEMVTVEGSSMGLLPGDTVSYRDLLYGMLLASGNDAANTTAYVLGGSPEGFARLMNKKAAELGLLHTNFVTPSGLDDENHYTTAKELALLARYAMKNEAFAEAAGSKTATLCYGNPPYKRSIRNHNKLLNSYKGLIGVKTGFTKKSGRCLVTAAKREEEYLIAVTLNDPNDWADHTNMLDFGFSVLEEKDIVYEKSCTEILVIDGKETAVKLSFPELKIGLTEAECEKISTEILVPKFIYAPVNKGDKVGTVSFYIDGMLLEEMDITAQSSIEKNESNASGLMKKIINRFLYLIKNF